MRKHSAKNVMVGRMGILYCTQLFCRLCCVARRYERLAYMQIYAAVSWEKTGSRT